MDRNDKFKLEQQTKRRYMLLRFMAGCKAVASEKEKRVYIAGYAILALIVWLFRAPIFGLSGEDAFAVIKRAGIENLFPVAFIAGLILLIMLFSMPSGSKSINDNLQRIGLMNHAGETPLLMARYSDNANPIITILEFEANGVPLEEWESKRAKIEAVLNVHTVKIKEGANKRRILLYTVPAQNGLSKMLRWKGEYLSCDNFVLTMGESFSGQVTVNLAHIPHILLGGSTGSGKSVLLKLLVMQCVKKGAMVHIADFKGGVDYPAVWHSRCEVIIDEQKLMETLSTLLEELERRKGLFRQEDCSNIDVYNRKTGATLPRMIFACDEVAELLDKTGLDKQKKDIVAQVENKLSTIARQGRAFGVHLILATQRPDATILAGQIRNNIDFRVCGRADNVLSQIILDNTSASDRIPKDAQGRFITGDGTVFQGYLFDDSKGW